jgi:hypothetical protein
MTNAKNIRQTRAAVTKASPAASDRGKPVRQRAVAEAAPVPKAAAKKTPKTPLGVTAAAKPKLVRDSFTIPKPEYAVLESLKLRAATLARPSKKSEVLRAGIVVLNAMNDKAFVAALNAVTSLKTGRPKGSGLEAAAKTATAKR